MREPKIYIKNCPLCGKKFVYVHKGQFEYNYNVHLVSCKKKQKKKLNKQEDKS